MLNGMFAFILYDKKKGQHFIARDHIGIIPLYVGWDDKGTFYVASEMKALNDYCSTVKEFPPGHYMMGNQDFVRWYKPEWARKFRPRNCFSLTSGKLGKVGEGRNDVRCSLRRSHLRRLRFFVDSRYSFEIQKETG